MFQNLLEWSNEKKLKFRGNRVNILLWESQHIWFWKIKANSQFHNLHLNSAKTYSNSQILKRTRSFSPAAQERVFWLFQRLKIDHCAIVNLHVQVHASFRPANPLIRTHSTLNTTIALLRAPYRFSIEKQCILLWTRDENLDLVEFHYHQISLY